MRYSTPDPNPDEECCAQTFCDEHCGYDRSPSASFAFAAIEAVVEAVHVVGADLFQETPVHFPGGFIGMVVGEVGTCDDKD